MDYSLPGSSVHGISQGRNIGVGCHFLLQAIFLTRGSNPCLLHCSRFITAEPLRKPRYLLNTAAKISIKKPVDVCDPWRSAFAHSFHLKTTPLLPALRWHCLPQLFFSYRLTGYLKLCFNDISSYFSFPGFQCLKLVAGQMRNKLGNKLHQCMIACLEFRG